MKLKHILLFTLSIISSYAANMASASITLEGTRVIYDERKKETAMMVKNPDDSVYLVQSWVEQGHVADTMASSTKAPFVVTPPLFRLESDKNNILRIVRTTGNFPADRESLFWLNIKAIPAVTEESNVLYIAIKHRLKLIYRPEGLRNPDFIGISKQLQWQREGQQLKVTNPTPHIVSFRSVTLNGKRIENTDYVLPFSSAEFAFPGSTRSGKVSWQIINDFGGTEKADSISL